MASCRELEFRGCHLRKYSRMHSAPMSHVPGGGFPADAAYCCDLCWLLLDRLLLLQVITSMIPVFYLSGHMFCQRCLSRHAEISLCLVHTVLFMLSLLP